LNLFVPNQTNVDAQSSIIVDDDFSKNGGAGIQVDVMTWSYDFTKNDGATFQCHCDDFGCNNPDNSSLNLRIKDDCSWEQPCGGKDVPAEGAFCQPFYGYGVPTNGFTTVSVTKGSGDHDCAVTVSPQQNGNWELVCNTHIHESQSCHTQIPASAAMYYANLKSDIRGPGSSVSQANNGDGRNSSSTHGKGLMTSTSSPSNQTGETSTTTSMSSTFDGNDDSSTTSEPSTFDGNDDSSTTSEPSPFDGSDQTSTTPEPSVTILETTSDSSNKTCGNQICADDENCVPVGDNGSICCKEGLMCGRLLYV
jgi:hypothetical protein